MEPENDNNLKDEILVNYLKSKAYKDLTWQEQDILFKKAPGFITEEMAQAHLDSLVKPSSKEKQNPQQILEIEYENFKSDFPSDSKEISYKIAQYLVDKHHAKTIGEKVRNIYIYKDGIYILGINFLKEEIQEILEEHASTHHKNNIIEMVKDLTLTDRKEFKADENLINLNNGIFNIKTKELIVHNHEHLFFTKIPVNYDINAECPEIKRFLSQILDEEYIDIIQEWFGYCLYRSYFIKKAIILVGERDTGKTTLLKVLQSFLGIENFSGVNLQMISSGRFSLSNLENKHANIYDDLSFKDINDNGTFKMLTGGGFATAEKKFGELFQFINYAKLTFSCNKIPKITDTDDDAYFGRWIIVRFDHKAEKLDKFLIDKITTQEEISGLLNFSLEGIDRLLMNQNFSYQRTIEEIKKEMTMSGSSLAQFTYFELEIVPDSNVFITKDEMHQEFINYIKNNNLPPMHKETLGKDLPKYIKVSSGKKSIKNQDTGKSNQVNCWLGVKFKNPKENKITGIEKINSDDGLFDFPER